MHSIVGCVHEVRRAGMKYRTADGSFARADKPILPPEPEEDRAPKTPGSTIQQRWKSVVSTSTTSASARLCQTVARGMILPASGWAYVGDIIGHSLKTVIVPNRICIITEAYPGGGSVGRQCSRHLANANGRDSGRSRKL